MKRIAAVVVTYNRCALLMQCLERLRAQKLPEAASLDILVIDNASTDDTLYMLTPFIEDGTIHYYNTGANLGGAGGFAFGMQAAVEAGFDYVWVMDDDCLPEPYALTALFKAADSLQSSAAPTSNSAQASSAASAQHTTPPISTTRAENTTLGVEAATNSATGHGTTTNWGFLSSVVRWTNGDMCTMNIQRHPLFTNIKDFSPALQPCTLASFVSLLVPAEVVRAVGLPHAEFFIWTDDWEFTRRISRRWPCYVVGESHVVHASSTNNPGNIYTDPPERLDRYAYIYRNDGVLYRAEGLKGKAFLWLRALYHSLRVIGSNTTEKKRRLGLIWAGTREGFSFNPEIHYPA